MRIALITRRYPPLIGGAEKVLSYLAPELAEQGADITVLTARFGEAASLPEREVLPTSRGSLEIVRLATSPLRFVGTWLYMRNLRHQLERNPPDVAYVSMLKHDAYVAVAAGRRAGFPVVLRPEGAGATGDLAWQSWGRFGRIIGRRCRQADALVAISKAVRQELIQNGYDASRIVDLPNGVPVPSQLWNRRDSWRDAPRAAFVGRLAPEKGLDVLLDAWPIVRRRHPAARLVLIGEGPMRPSLDGQAERLGIRGAVEFTGRVDDATPLIRGCDLFVLPSREEGMSIALLEAMALGIPLVASAIPGNRKLVIDRKHGRLAPPDDPRSLAETILAQWAEFDRAIHMGRAARSLVQQKYSAHAMARQHLALFQNLVRDRP